MLVVMRWLLGVRLEDLMLEVVVMVKLLEVLLLSSEEVLMMVEKLEKLGVVMQEGSQVALQEELQEMLQ
jgi:hypothetical protein